MPELIRRRTITAHGALRQRRRADRAALAVACAGLALAGCGGTSAGADFAAKATAICSAADRQLGALQRAGTGVDASAISGLVAREIRIDTAEIRSLAAISAPAGERTSWADAVAQAANDVALLPKIRAAMERNDQAALSAVTQQSSALSLLAIAAMKRLGLPRCARNL